jgi:hypothetical protein
MTPESVDDLLELVRDRMTRRTGNYTVEEEEACVLQSNYKN